MQKFRTRNGLQERCFRFGLDTIWLTDKLPKKRAAWVITDQLIRSSTSIGANLIEGSASSSRREFKKFFEIALKSANETGYWLELLQQSELINPEEIEPLIIEGAQIASMIAAGVIKLKS